MTSKSMLNRLPPFILYSLSYLLLWEWLLPLQKLDLIRDINVFLFYIVFTFVVNIFSIRFIWKILIQFVFISLILTYGYYSVESFLTGSWLVLFWEDSLTGIAAVWNQQWAAVPNSFATAFFLLLLWSIMYLFNVWIIQRKSLFFFFISSILFIAILDTFTPYDGDMAIIRIFVLGLFIMGCLHFYRLSDIEHIVMEWKDLLRWVLPLVGMIAFSAIIGLLAPKLPAQWKDPVPYIISYSEKFKGGQVAEKTVGYGEDDTKLGGDFRKDHSVVFTVKTKRQHYWFVESKNYYTGEGWETRDNKVWSERFDHKGFIPYETIHSKGTAQLTDQVEIAIPYNHVPFPTPVVQAQIDASSQFSFLYYPFTNKVISVNQQGKGTDLKQYDVKYSMPIYDIAVLRTIKDIEAQTVDKTYLQTPSAFPERIRDLTISITKDADNLYDKVKAVENYFDRSEFIYAREDIPYPEENEDFVDQFLFETLRGYCDHFSTSMVMMLRSIGIQAKWVKGYTGGDFVKYEDGQSIYEITNNNAHSWVEVYFPDIGWIPFEPTKGYSNYVQFENTTSTTLNGGSTQETPMQEETRQESPIDEQDKKDSNDEQLINSLRTVMQEIKVNGWKMAAAIGLTVIIGFVGYVIRVKWIPYIWFFYFRHVTSDHTFLKAYQVLLKQLKRRGLKRECGQTLREYAKYVDEYFSIQEMSKLTSYYEQTLYGPEKDGIQWNSVKSAWKTVMKKTIT